MYARHWQTGHTAANMSSLALAQAIGPGPELGSVPATEPRDADLITIPGGTVHIGDDAVQFDELPAFDYTSPLFLMDRTPVTVAQFAAFVKDTGCKTDAERYGIRAMMV